MDLLWCMGGFNTTSSPCGVWEVANYFFASEVKTSTLASRVVVLATCAFEALDVDFRQSLAICPVRSQNIHSLLSKQCLCLAVVSLLSLPNFDEMSGLGKPELVEVLVAFPEDSLDPWRCWSYCCQRMQRQRVCWRMTWRSWRASLVCSAQTCTPSSAHLLHEQGFGVWQGSRAF